MLDGTRKTILVVDDEEDIRLTLKMYLSSEGYSVLTATDGLEALDIFSKSPVDLVLSDVRMPNMDGVTLMRHIKEQNEDIEIIILTGYASLENAVEALRENGAFEYLLKPVNDLDVLNNTIKKALNYSHLKRENKQLIDQLQQSKANLEKTNSALLLEIQKRTEAEAQLKQMATTDALTAISNRRHFMEIAAQEIARSIRYNSPLTLAFLDIDHFKLVNDTYGHATGDAVLQTMAEHTQTLLRNADHFGRIGGEEFAILFTETEIGAAATVAERVRQGIEQLVFTSEGNAFKVTVSMGLSQLNVKDTYATLSMRADNALYAAKAQGRNSVVVK